MLSSVSMSDWSVKTMKLKVEHYTISDLTQDELDLIYAALCRFPKDNPEPRCGDALTLAEKFRPYQSTVLANRERGEDGNKC